MEAQVCLWVSSTDGFGMSVLQGRNPHGAAKRKQGCEKKCGDVIRSSWQKNRSWNLFVSVGIWSFPRWWCSSIFQVSKRLQSWRSIRKRESSMQREVCAGGGKRRGGCKNRWKSKNSTSEREKETAWWCGGRATCGLRRGRTDQFVWLYAVWRMTGVGMSGSCFLMEWRIRQKSQI